MGLACTLLTLVRNPTRFTLHHGHLVMYDELYPAPQVKWYPRASELARTSPSGFTYPGTKTEAESFGGLSDAQGLSDASFTYIRSEYGRQTMELSGASFYTQ